MFGYDGSILLPSEKFYNKEIVIERGSFYPLTNLHLDIIQAGIKKCRSLGGKDIFPVLEISMRNIFISSDEQENLKVFLQKAEMLCKAGANVLITDYPEYYKVSQYLNRNTKRSVNFCIGVNLLEKLFEEKFYEQLPGGLLEAFGKMFRKQVKIFAYPYKDFKTNKIISLDDLKVDSHIQGILEYFKRQQYIIPLDNYNSQYLGHNSEFVTKLMQDKNEKWQDFVPSILVNVIKKSKLHC